MYAFQPLEAVTVNISLCESSFDTKLILFEETTNSRDLTLLSCNDDGCDTQSWLQVMHTTCTLHRHYMHTTCTLNRHCMHITRTLHTHTLDGLREIGCGSWGNSNHQRFACCFLHVGGGVMILNASDNSSNEHISQNAKIMLISAVT